MSKIDVSQWKEFKVGDLFIKISTKKLKYRTRDLPKMPDAVYNLPASTASAINQGLSVYVPKNGATILYKCLLVLANGDAGTVFYEPKPFTVLQDSYALKLKQDINKYDISNVYLFLASVLTETFHYKFGWDNKAVWSRASNLTIKLPVTKDGQPNWQYMDSYIAKRAALAHKYVSELKATKNQRQPLKISGWQEYKLSDLFEPEFTDGDNKVQNLEQSDGGVNLVGPLNSNNGVLGKFISDTKVFSAGTLTWDMFGKCYEQFEPYQTVSHGHVLVLNPKVKLDEFSLLFVASVLTRLGQNSHFGYNNMLTISKFNKLTIKLPALADGTPDWATMRKRVADLAALSHRQLQAFKQVVH